MTTFGDALKEYRDRIEAMQFPDTRMAKYMGLPPRYRGKLFGNLDKRYRRQIDVALRAIEGGHNIIITGAVGTGKTHLAVCLLWQAIKEEIEIGLDFANTPMITNRPWEETRFLAAADLVVELKTSQWKEHEVLERYAFYETLLLDDLGFEMCTEATKGWIATLLDRRYRSMRRTIITSNLNLEQLGAAIDDRVVSRLIEDGVVIPMDGPDFRKVMAQAIQASLTTTAQKDTAR